MCIHLDAYECLPLKVTPKSMTHVRLAKDFNHVIQWGILYHRRIMISHCIDVAIRWSAASILPDRHTIGSGTSTRLV